MSSLFRKNALEKLSSPDRFEERLTLISPRRWLALAALAGVLAAAALWGAFGRLPTHVRGAGMLLERGGFRNVASLADGVVGRLLVREGDAVEEGDVLGLVDLPLQELELKYYRDKLDLLRAEMDEIGGAAEANRAEREDFHARLRAGNDESLDKLAQILDQLAGLSDTYRAFGERGIVARIEALRMLQNTLNASIDVTRQRQETMRADIEKADFDLAFKRQFWQMRNRLMDAEFELQSKLDQFLNRTRILSPARGAIVNVQKSEGDPVAVGEVVFLLQPSHDGRLYAAAFVPAARSKNVREGQPVLVAPSHVEPQRAGYVRGTVLKVGRYPATFQQLVNVFKNRDLTEMLKGDEVAVEVEVALLPDPADPARVRWTGRPPPGVEIGAGMICQVAIEVERRSPLSYVLPWIRETLLGETAPGLGGGARAP